MFDRNMRYLQFSDRWLQDTAVENKNLLGNSHYEVFPNQPSHWAEMHRRGLAGGESVKAEEEWTAADGKVHSIRWKFIRGETPAPKLAASSSLSRT